MTMEVWMDMCYGLWQMVTWLDIVENRAQIVKTHGQKMQSWQHFLNIL